MLALEQTLSKFISVLEPNSTHITNFPCLAFLCGGSTEDASNIRSKTFKYIEAADPELYARIKLAEKFSEWTDPEFYTNLIDLEDDLAHIVSFVPIILESPGSVSEFGSFVNNPNIFPKLKVYLLREHANAQSYIALGPVKKLKDHDEALIFTYEENMDDAVASIVYNDIKEKTKPKHIAERLKIDNKAHQILLICEFVRLLGLARVSEIKYLIRAFGMDLANMDIKHYLKLCQKLEILDFKNFGHGSDGVFYVANNKNLNFTIFGYRPNVRRKDKDLLRWKAIFREEILEKDNYRKALLASFENQEVIA